MSKVTIKNFFEPQWGGVAIEGNVTSYRFPLDTDANGAAKNANSAAALAIGDVVDLGALPGGMVLEDSQVIVTTALTAAVTASLGFAYADGVDHPDVPQDAAYFGAGIALSAAARIRNSVAKLVTLPKDARLILTIAGAANAKAGALVAIVHGERQGRA